ncbi:YbhN family protein [Paracoccus sp. (in: a-proteobacteria)]|uniref:lysylphosphatidylglycerol synthase transmembrane domain-containing protein n=1 Tax=Paracoccus sp. TaxID=267 RepID=UPI00396C7478
MTGARVLQIVAAVLLLGLLWTGLDGPAAISLLAHADAGWLAAAMAALTAQTLLSALRWQMIAALLGQTIPLRRAVAEYYLGQVVNQSLPGGVLGDAGRAVRTRHIGGLRRSGAAVAIERLTGQIVLFAVLLGGVAAVLLSPDGLRLPTWVLGLVAVLLLICLVAAGGMTAMRSRPGRMGKAARDMGRMIRLTLFTRHALPRQLVLNLVIIAANLAAFACCARATGTILSLGETTVLVPLILLTMILPLTISGWGLREGAAASLFPLAGASASAGVAASLAFGLIFLASTLPGVLVLLFCRRSIVARVPS